MSALEVVQFKRLHLVQVVGQREPYFRACFSGFLEEYLALGEVVRELCCRAQLADCLSLPVSLPSIILYDTPHVQ